MNRKWAGARPTEFRSVVRRDAFDWAERERKKFDELFCVSSRWLVDVALAKAASNDEEWIFDVFCVAFEGTQHHAVWHSPASHRNRRGTKLCEASEKRKMTTKKKHHSWDYGKLMNYTFRVVCAAFIFSGPAEEENLLPVRNLRWIHTRFPRQSIKAENFAGRWHCGSKYLLFCCVLPIGAPASDQKLQHPPTTNKKKNTVKEANERKTKSWLWACS